MIYVCNSEYARYGLIDVYLHWTCVMQNTIQYLLLKLIDQKYKPEKKITFNLTVCSSNKAVMLSS